MRSRRPLPVVVAGLAAIATAVLAAPATQAGPAGTAGARGAAAEPSHLVVRDGTTQRVFTAEPVHQRVWVRTPVDTDHDGARDRVVIDVYRPAATDHGLKVASVVDASPYYGGGQDVPNHEVDVARLPQEGAAGRTAAGDTGTDTDTDTGTAARRTAALRARTEAAGRALAQRYTPRGYATVLAQVIGSADSQGCPTVGDRNETLSAKAVVEWLHGTGVGYDAGGRRVRATWSTGNVGMMGVSYDGTLPQMVATTGVAGLRTIVPVSAISSWYDYYRANGLVVAPGGYQGEDTDVLGRFDVSDAQQQTCRPVLDGLEKAQDRVTGDYSRFWAARDYTGRVGRIRASVFVVHGLNDWNVKTQQFAQFWRQLGRHHVARKIWLHRGEHGGPAGPTTYTLPDGEQRDYYETVDRWLDHYLYGVRNGITAEPRAIVQREDDAYRTYRNWPDPGARPVTLHPGGTQPGTLGHRAPAHRPAPVSFTDDGREKTAEQLAADPDTAGTHHLTYVTGPLAHDRRLSGTPRVRLRLSVDDRADANVTALLVDYGPGDATPVIVTRGWIDPQNRGSRSVSRRLVEGRRYDLAFGLQPKDYVVPAGHRLGLVVISTDHDYTLRPDPGTTLTLDPARTRLTVPVVGGHL